MPRTGRAVLTGYPHHVIQWGHNRNVVFVEADDFRYYIDTLGEWSTKFGVSVHAYCLMTNHMHLLLEPEKRESDVLIRGDRGLIKITCKFHMLVW